MKRKYGEVLEKLLVISGQKNTVLADELGYDVTYIGKWINGKRLPSVKNVISINKSIAEFVVEFSDIDNEELRDFLGIKKTDNILSSIENMLMDAYNISNGKSPLEENIEHDNDILDSAYEYNGSFMLSPTERRNYFRDVLDKDVEKVDSLDVVMMANIYSMSQREKLYISGMKKIGVHGINTKDVRVKLINDFTDTSRGDLIYNSIFFINMMANSEKSNLEVYSYDFAPYTVVTAIKDMFLYNAVFTNPENCLMSTCTKDKKTVNEVYESLVDIIETQAIKTFSRKTPLEMINNDLYLDFLGNEKFKLMLNQFTELFLPTDLFMEIGTSIFGNDKEMVSKLKKIDFFLKNIIGKLGLDLIIYENMFDSYIASGEILFFNNKVTLTVEQRIKSVTYFKEFLSNNDLVDLKVLEDDFVKKLKHFSNPNLYLSKKISFIPSSCCGSGCKYLVVNDNNLDKSLNKFFNQIWSDESLIILDKKEALSEVEKKILYSRYLLEEVSSEM